MSPDIYNDLYDLHDLYDLYALSTYKNDPTRYTPSEFDFSNIYDEEDASTEEEIDVIAQPTRFRITRITNNINIISIWEYEVNGRIYRVFNSLDHWAENIGQNDYYEPFIAYIDGWAYIFEPHD